MGEWVRASFGFTAGGEEVSAWTIRAGEYSARVLSYGGVLQSFSVPAPEGERDIVLGFDTLAEYEAQDKYIGALVGRVANRIGGASFTLGGVRYPLAANSGPNCLHGGRRGFDRAVWRGEARGELLVLSVTGDGFLYNMVRILAGTVLEVCAGRLSPGEIPGILRARDRSLAGPTLPPHGLYLDRVFYPGKAAGQAP